MGIINLVGDGKDLDVFTQHRPMATVPFGGRYRLIDFVLSGMVNSGIENVGVLTPHRNRSLADHLRAGQDWNLASKKDGLVLLPPSYPESEESGGDIRSFYSNLDFLHKSTQEYVLVAGADVVGNLYYRDVLKFHEETAADITFIYKNEDYTKQDCPNCMVADVQPVGRVAGIRLNPESLDSGNFLLGTFIMKKDLLVKLVAGCIDRGGPDSLVRAVADKLGDLRARAFHYPGYIARIHCLNSYYHHSLDLLKPDVWRQLFGQGGKIYTRVRDDAPAHYTKHARVANVLMGAGCFIAGTVENSVLFRRVTVRQGATIKGSILMPNTEVAENAVLENVICDKDVRISAGKCLRGKADNPFVVKKGTVI